MKHWNKEADAYRAGIKLGQDQAAMVYQTKVDDLLAACEQALSSILNHEADCQQSVCTNEEIEQLRAAIKKATSHD